MATQNKVGTLTWDFVDISCKQPIGCLLCIRTSQVKFTKVRHVKDSYRTPTGETLILNLKIKYENLIHPLGLINLTHKQTVDFAHNVMMWRKVKGVLLAKQLVVPVRSVFGNIVGTVEIII